MGVLKTGVEICPPANAAGSEGKCQPPSHSACLPLLRLPAVCYLVGLTYNEGSGVLLLERRQVFMQAEMKQRASVCETPRSQGCTARHQGFNRHGCCLCKVMGCTHTVWDHCRCKLLKNKLPALDAPLTAASR
jgi:hypothetical protein